MPFQEINVDNILDKKFIDNPGLKKEFEEVETEIDVIVQIVKARNDKGLSQKELADIAGLTQQMVSRIETREFSPNLRNLLRVADALGLKLTVTSK